MKQQNTSKHAAEVLTSILKSVVGYLGTIEMPTKDGVTGLTAIRNCIRRLRVEKKVHTMVLMCILPEKIILINHHGLKIAEYPCDRVTFCGMYMDDKRFFGLVTSQQVDDDDDEDVDVVASSCHVFMVEPLTDREEIRRRAKAFQFEPTPSTNFSGEFDEFPHDARPIIKTVMTVFGKDQEEDDFGKEQLLQLQEPAHQQQQLAVVHQPQLSSNSSSSAGDVRSGTSSSTNSDSGIGYRDDPDHILLMDPQSPPMGMPPVAETDADADAAADADENVIQENAENEEKEKLDVRAMPPPKDVAISPEVVGAAGGLADCSFNTEVLESQNSAANLRQSMQKYLQSKHDHLKKTSQQLAGIDSRAHQASSKPRLVTPTSSSASTSSTRDNGRRNLFPEQQIPSSSGFVRAASERSSVRSLEDVRFEKAADFSPPNSFRSSELFSGAARFPTTSALLDAASPLARFLYSSETNLSQLAESQMTREQPLLCLVPGLTRPLSFNAIAVRSLWQTNG